jgi:hypothetical protein
MLLTNDYSCSTRQSQKCLSKSFDYVLTHEIPASEKIYCKQLKPGTMQSVLVFAGQNWLITPAALAANESRPQDIHDQKWLLTLSGVGLINLKGNSTSNWLHDTIHILPDMFSPLNFALVTHAIPKPPEFDLKFQVEQMAPFSAMSSVFNQGQSINSGFAVDTWRPAPFETVTNALNGRTVSKVFTGIRVDVAVRDTDAFMFRISYHVTLLGKITFVRGIVIT